nr:transposase [Streptomyces sp. CBMA152]
MWARIEPLLPAWPQRSAGPRPVDDRLCRQGLLFVLYTGMTWQQLPLELGFGPGQVVSRLREEEVARRRSTAACGRSVGGQAEAVHRCSAPP